MPHSKKDAPEWTPVHTPFQMDLFDVEHTVDGPYAVGASGTVAANRGDGWEVIVDAGPAAKNSTLHAMAVTDDGERIWFVGASGAIGAYDVKEQKKYDYSYSGQATTTWQTLAVNGKAGSETVLVANGSGTVVAGKIDGFDVTWENNVTPGTGASISAMAVSPDGMAYMVDSSGNAYKSTGAKKWENIGIVNASVGFNDIYAGSNARVYVAADDGSLYRYDEKAKSWTPIEVTTSALVAVDVFQGHIVALSANSTFFMRAVDGQSRWRRLTQPTGNDLVALALGYPDVAVGKAGTVVRRKPLQPPKTKQEKKEKPKDPKKTKQPDPLVSCEFLVKELVRRLSREELIELIETQMGCESAVVDHLKGKKETLEDVEVALLPVLEEELAARERTSKRRRHEHTHRHEEEVDLTALLERIRTC